MAGKENLIGVGRNVSERLKRNWIGLVITAAIFVGLYLWLGATTAFFISLFVLLYVLHVEGRIAVAAGIVALVVCAILLMIQHQGQAETWASRAFYLLLMGIALQFIELRRDIRRKAIEVEEDSALDELDGMAEDL